MRGTSLTPLAFVSALCTLLACAPDIQNVAGRRTVYQDPQAQGLVAGLGVESQDIVGMTDRLVRDLLATPQVAALSAPPRVIFDSAYFENHSAQRMNKDLIINRMRIRLQRAAEGRLVFVAREYADMVAKERELKRSDRVDVGAQGLARAQFGADYRLVGSIDTLDARSMDGAMERYTQITFELVDLETGQQVWGGQYEFSKAGQEDAIYR